MEPVAPVLFGDTVQLVIEAIRDGFALQSVDAVVDNEVPDEAVRYVVVRRQGGPRVDLVRDSAQIRIECLAPTKAEAHDLAQMARAYVFAMRGTVRHGITVGRIEEFAGPAELPDPISQLPRYLFTELVHTRGRALLAP